MIKGIREYIENNYPDVVIVSAIEIENQKDSDRKDFPSVKFYDVTFEYKGKHFMKMFHTHHNETIEEQFKEALTRSNIKISNNK